MKKTRIEDPVAWAKYALNKKYNCITVRRLVAFIERQPDDADIAIIDIRDFKYSGRRNRKNFYEAEIVAASWPTSATYTWAIAYRPEE